MRLLAVLGMHRSGTSAVTGLLSKMGVDMGPEEHLLPPAPDNPLGFFENQKLYRIDRRLLHHFGGNWSNPPFLPPDWVADERILEERRRASLFLEELAEGRDGWVAVKDPRLCLLLPFWASLHPIEHVIHVLRDPFDVASSLRKRNGFDLETGAKLWLRYVGAAFRNYPDATRIHYDDLIENTEKIANQVGLVLGLETAAEGIQSDIVRRSLRHTHDSKAFHSEVGELAQLIHHDLVRSGGPSQEIEVVLRVLGHPGMGLLAERDVSWILANTHESSQVSADELRAKLQVAEAELGENQARADHLSTSLQELDIQLRESVDHELTVDEARAETRELQATLDSSEARAEALESQYRRLRSRKGVRLALGAARLIKPLVRPAKMLRRRKRERETREDLHQLAGAPIPQPTDFRARSASFDSEMAAETERILDARYTLDPERFDNVNLSVVLPTYNRRKMLRSAIKSVLNQTHRNWDLIVVDDGSTDGSKDVVSELIQDERVQWISTPNRGVSAARNVGLEHATGEYVAYLDSDNRWTKHHLRSMVVALETTSASAGYTALNAETLDGEYLYTRGASFDWVECRSANYVDLNVFVHRRGLVEGHDGFQTQLKRMVDWEFILRLTEGEEVQYVPVLGCRYRDHDDETRISNSKPMAFDAVLKTRIPEEGPPAVPWGEVARRLSLSFALKVPAPEHKKAEWGDYHFAVSLGRELEALGHRTGIEFLQEWDNAGYADVNLVLRGLTPYTPANGALNLMWNISHADKIPYDEYRNYDLVYTASESFARFLQLGLGGITEIRYLPQATDPTRFNPALAGTHGVPQHPLLFVGNSRKEHRDIVRWAIEAGLHPAVYGTNWEEFLPEGVIEGTNIPNDELGKYYANADVVLNDHWPSMRDFGFVSNRVFDVLATGTKLVSDRTAALTRMFGPAVSQVGSTAEMETAINDERSTDGGEKLSEYLLEHHTFRRRAEVIVDDVLGLLGLERIHGTAPEQLIPPFNHTSRQSNPRGVGLVITHGRDGPQSSAFIRLINSLTQESIVDRVSVREIDYKDPDPTEVVVVQRTSIPTLDDVDRFLGRIRSQSSRLVVDVDDAFLLIDPSHPEYQSYQKRNKALEVLLGESDQAWFSTPLLSELYSHVTPDNVRIIRNTLDPRPWRFYRRRTDPIDQRRGPVRLLYMGTATHDADFVLVGDALAELYDQFDFTLTVIGALRHPPVEHPWLEVVDVPEGIGVYPQFVRWLKTQPKFDIGVSPLLPSEFNEAKSDVKFLDYSALGLVSVLSKGSAYQEVIDKSLAVGAGPEGWTDALGSVLEDPEGHRKMSRAATDYLWSERSTIESAERMVEALDDLTGRVG